MKKYYFLIIVALIFGLVLTGCSLLLNISQVPTTGQSGIINLTKGTPGTITLYAGQDIDVGTVTVSNDSENLYIKYETTGDWYLTETHLHVACYKEDIPQNKQGNPIPGKFMHNMEHIYVQEYELDPIPLEDFKCTDLCIAAHAVVVNKLEPIVGCYETVWQIGDVEEDKTVIPYDEFNYPIQVTGPQDFYVDTTSTAKFPYFSRPPNSAPIINIYFNAEMLLGGKFLFSWSPGNSGIEIIEVLLDGTKFGEITRSGASTLGWWKSQERFIDSFDVPAIEAGDHVLTINVTAGNGLVWDWIRLEKPCVQKESAWGAGTRFVQKGNWATYFTYTILFPPQDDLVLWLDAGKGITEGSVVSIWEDQSGIGNHAVQTTSGNQPTYITSGLNGLPVVQFDGVNDHLIIDALLAGGESGRTILIVAKSDTTNNKAIFMLNGDRSGTGNARFYDITPEIWVRVYGNQQFSEVFPDDFAILTIGNLQNAKVNEIYGWLDGSPLAAVGCTNCNVPLSIQGTRSSIGTILNAITVYAWKGDIAEILVYNRALSDLERIMAGAYLNAKYDIY